MSAGIVPINELSAELQLFERVEVQICRGNRASELRVGDE